jgi:hypothetical protein
MVPISTPKNEKKRINKRKTDTKTLSDLQKTLISKQIVGC